MGIQNLSTKINFCTPGSCWILLGGIEVTYPKRDHICQIMSNYMFWGRKSNFVIKNKFLDTWQLLDPAGSSPDPGIKFI